MLDNNMTSVGGEAAPATKKSHLSKKLLVKDKFLSKITFTKNSNTTTNNNPQHPLDSEIFSVKQTEVIMVKDPDKNNATPDSGKFFKKARFIWNTEISVSIAIYCYECLF